ncbi:Crp/Fnr family transcriptional regulator [Sphingomonas sp. R86521]|uniref:Crp/Fnr family transcriptional regulator n=1 Tax=Sphingomonas sp. R86521 TaxID=3093860 RepID=UPI0036D35454
MRFEPFLRKLEVAEPLSPSERHAALQVCVDVRLAKRRSDIVADDAVPDRVYIILSGWAARYKILRDGSRRITAFMLPGDFSDIDAAVLQRTDHGISAITDCEVAHVPVDRMEAFATATPRIMRAMRRATVVDASIVRQWLAVAARRSALETTAHLFAELHARLDALGRVAQGQTEFPLTQEELGDATGMTVIHANRTLRELRERGLMTLGKGRLYVPDVKALGKAGGFDPRYLHFSKPALPTVTPKRSTADAFASTPVRPNPIWVVSEPRV